METGAAGPAGSRCMIHVIILKKKADRRKYLLMIARHMVQKIVNHDQSVGFSKNNTARLKPLGPGRGILVNLGTSRSRWVPSGAATRNG